MKISNAARPLAIALALSACSTSGPAKSSARFNGNPLVEQARNTRHGDYRYRGLTDAAGHRSVPGADAGKYDEKQVEYVPAEKTEAVEHYLSRYNEALASERRGKRLDANGMLVK